MLSIKTQKGFTLVEALVGAAVFLIVAMGVYNSYANLFRFMSNAQYKELAVDLAEEQMEIIRNMPYADIGVEGSIPSGNIPYEQFFWRGGIKFKVNAIVRNIDLPNDGVAGGSPNDTAPNDNKLVSLSVSCDGCGDTKNFTITGRVAPLSLESSGNTGSLFIHVHDAVGNPVQGANVLVENSQGTSTITINDVTDNNGLLALVGVPPGSHAYHIVVSKNGYSSDQTYPLGGGSNPNPTNADANVITGQVTSVDFFIDKTSSLSVKSVSPSCEAKPNFHFNLTGSKTIGPGVPKYSEDLVTDSSGTLEFPTMEWDTGYRINPLDTVYDLAGINPGNPLSLNPNANVDLKLIVVPKNSKSLMVSVTDASTGLPLSGVTVELSKSGYDEIMNTGEGFISQSDWSHGSGQSLYVDPAAFFGDDGNVDTTGIVGDMRLKSAFGVYNSSGYLISSTFDTGTTSNFYSFIWSPENQPQNTSTKFQFAVATSSTPSVWSFTGPDGTSGTFYTSSNSSFNSVVNGNRYARYKVFLETASSTVTPDISDVGFTYTSDCLPPGQVLFQGLSTGNYEISISKSGYNTVIASTTIGTLNWQEFDQALSQ